MSVRDAGVEVFTRSQSELRLDEIFAVGSERGIAMRERLGPTTLVEIQMADGSLGSALSPRSTSAARAIAESRPLSPPPTTVTARAVASPAVALRFKIWNTGVSLARVNTCALVRDAPDRPHCRSPPTASSDEAKSRTSQSIILDDIGYNVVSPMRALSTEVIAAASAVLARTIVELGEGHRPR